MTGWRRGTAADRGRGADNRRAVPGPSDLHLAPLSSRWRGGRRPGPIREVAAAAEERRLFLNAVDDPANASLYLGGVVRRGGVTAAISTDGRAPALAGLIREALEALLPEDEVRRWLAAADDERAGWLARRVPMERRRPLLVRALAALYRDRTSTEGSTETEEVDRDREVRRDQGH